MTRLACMIRRLGRPAVAATVALALLVSGCSVFGGEDTYTIDVEFARTYNLFPGSPVRVLGIQVGKVIEVSTSPDDGYVTTTLELDADTELPQDVGAVIIPQSLLGERYVQLFPPYTGGDTLKAGGIVPMDRTQVPSEFDEILESLNSFVGGIDEDEFARLFANLAAVVDEQGEALGRTIDNAHEAVGVLRENDEELIALASRLSDMNEIVTRRDDELAELLQDFNVVAESLIGDRVNLDRALRGLVRLTTEVDELLGEHRTDLQADVETLTRVSRTANRNLESISLGILSSAELFRHADRVVSNTRNWLPLVNHSESLGDAIAGSLAARLQNLCNGLGLPGDVCDQLAVGELLPAEVCAPPMLLCPEPGDGVEPEVPTLGETLRKVLDDVPELGDALAEQAEADDADQSDLPSGGDGP